MGYGSIDKASLVLDALSQKQEALGANLANINTPNYVRQDVDFGSLLRTGSSPLETKLATKLGASPFITQSGGEVSAPKEMIEMQRNMLLYTIATRNVSSVIQEMKTVLNVGK